MAAGKKVPLRQCLGCGEMKSKKEMLRIIRTAEGEVFLDVTGKKNGRGAYICKDAGCLEKARKKKALDRSLKIEISDEVYESLKGELDKIDK